MNKSIFAVLIMASSCAMAVPSFIVQNYSGQKLQNIGAFHEDVTPTNLVAGTYNAVPSGDVVPSGSSVNLRVEQLKSVGYLSFYSKVSSNKIDEGLCSFAKPLSLGMNSKINITVNSQIHGQVTVFKCTAVDN